MFGTTVKVSRTALKKVEEALEGSHVSFFDTPDIISWLKKTKDFYVTATCGHYYPSVTQI